MRVLILDNYDSFVWNLADYVGKLGAEPIVMRSTKLTLEDVESLDPERIIISPGPGHPSERRFTGVSADVVLSLGRRVPVLGVCLGMQLIGHALGGSVVRAKRVVHGKASKVTHVGEGVFRGLENPLTVGRYHSLVVREEDLPRELEVIARDLEDGELMAIRHRSWPLVGVQFHPESVLTPRGIDLLRNFLRGEL
ncbi:MAG: aminodeoxychorismate/anthranilate synthase component II [Aigarchaeota archaeon]|nr:aminodeoxychorismate/anthranilate synthase component II [Aigarchaeota archaeon]MCS7127093.1 aminodeoxychorismate/anthranilate synthase component II [Candidatus Calditenuaceae archaeon]MCX8203013.1 aminodeoxychorismate/anthranilate synthase component II [Nitrososphaeria archaeon]MDW8043217.1 aminodeoxychorismate/anthranilate synthase component II [Nitrososphaerota archaeon]